MSIIKLRTISRSLPADYPASTEMACIQANSKHLKKLKIQLNPVAGTFRWQGEISVRSSKFAQILARMAPYGQLKRGYSLWCNKNTDLKARCNTVHGRDTFGVG
jgi:hypothetical protein